MLRPQARQREEARAGEAEMGRVGRGPAAGQRRNPDVAKKGGRPQAAGQRPRPPEGGQRRERRRRRLRLGGKVPRQRQSVAELRREAVRPDGQGGRRERKAWQEDSKGGR
eukprot:gene14076-35075_t